MKPRPLNPTNDLSAVAELLGYTRANGGVWHPGGVAWWLRDLERNGFESWVVEADGRLDGFLLIDDSFVLGEHRAFGRELVNLLDWATDHLQKNGHKSVTMNVPDGSELERELLARGFQRTGFGYELAADTDNTDATAGEPALPEGFRFGSLRDVTDDAFIDGHRAAWSDTKPSPYRRELHDAVKAMPEFRSELVTIAIAPDGTVASYCIGWMDEQSKQLEIEPLGTHRDYRRLGLAHSVVREVIRRAGLSGARDVLVWNEPDKNVPAYGLYTSAGMSPRRTLTELTRQL